MRKLMLVTLSTQRFNKLLTIIPRVRVEYELAIIISYPTSTSGIIDLFY